MAVLSDFSVYRIGDGTHALAGEATEVFIDTYSWDGDSFNAPVLVSSIAMPTSGASTAFTVTGTGFTDGGLSRSDDGQYLVAGGYRKDDGTVGILATQTAATTPRVIGRVSVNGTVDTSTGLTDAYNSNTFRGVASADGNSFYTSGAAATNSGGVRYVASLGATASTNIGESSLDNVRQIYVVDGNLYLASSAGPPGKSVYQVGAGLPTTGPQTYTPLLEPETSLPEFFNSFYLADLNSSVPGFDTLYVVDSRGNNYGVEKWSLDTGVWTKNGATLTFPSGPFQASAGSPFGLTGVTQGDTTTLFMTTTSGGNGPSAIYALTDTAGYNAVNNGSVEWLMDAPSDGGGGNASVFKNIALAPSFAPAIVLAGGSAAYTENAAAVAVDSGLVLSDADSSNLYSGVVRIGSNFVAAEDSLTWTNSANVTGVYDAATGELRLTGTASVAEYQTVLSSVKYLNSSNDPSTLARTISFQVRDSQNVKNQAAARNVNVTAVNDTPSIAVPGSQNVGINKDRVFAAINGNSIGLVDIDAQSGSLQLTLSVSSGTVTLATLAGLSGSGNGTGSLSYTGTLSALNTALNGMYFTAPGSVTTVTLNVGLNDQGNTGSGGAKSDSKSITINVTNAINQAPLVTTTVAALTYNENAPATPIDPALTVTDGDNATLVGATVAITANYVQAEDVLAFVNQLGISGTFSALTGVLTLTGSATVANYQTALRSVTYTNTSVNPSGSVRTVTFRASDGTDLSVAKTRNINVTPVNDAPVNVVPGAQTIIKNGNRVFGAVALNQVSFSDVDASGNEQMTLTAANGTITLATLAGLSGSGNGTGSLTYTGSVAALNAALDGMLFTPTLNYTGTTSIALTTNDLGNSGSGGPQSTVTPISIVVVNPAPLVINEIMWDPPQSATNQYIELRSTAGGNFAVPGGYYLVGVEGHAAFNTGEVHDVFNLSSVGMTTGPNGYLTILQSSNLYTAPVDVTNPAGNKYQQGPISPAFGNNLAGLPSTVGHTASSTFTQIESANSTTFFLVYSATPPAIGDDIDSNDDGLPDGSVFNNWAVVDSIGRGNSLTSSTDFVYGKINFIDPTGTTVAVTGPSSLVTTTTSTNFTPRWIGRSGETTGSAATDWLAADLEGSTPYWEVSSLKSSLPGFAGLPLNHINGPNFPGVLAKPVADLNGPLDGRDSLASFISTDPAISVFSSLAAVTDTDSTNLTQIVVTITNPLNGVNETLAANTAGTSIVANYSGGVLTLSGSDTLAHYQQVLRSVTYNNTAVSPDRTTRSLTVVANDGVNSSLVSSAQIGIFTKTHGARLNELDVNPPGDDNGFEYIELKGTPGQSLTNMYLVAFEGNHLFNNPGDPGYNQEGTARFVQSLGSYSFGANGLLIVKSSTSGFTPPGATTVVTNTDLDTLAGGLRNGSNSFFLIHSSSFVPVKDTDYDSDNNGVLEIPGTVEVVDSIAWLDRDATQDIAYGTNQLTQVDSSPSGATRFPSTTVQNISAWYNGALMFNANPALQVTYDSTNASANLPIGAVLTPGSANFPTVVNSTIVDRHIFYNQSGWDGNSAAISPANDALAIATDKDAYIPGSGTAVFANMTSFTRGVNGIMVDLSAGVTHTGITAADFVFKVGNNNTPSGWAAAPAPSAISVVPGGGVGGSDRVIITWASASIANKWLEVQVLATANTGLAAADVHFWGNKIGDTANFAATTADSAQVFANLGAGKPITDTRDFNRDKSVTTADSVQVFANLGSIVAINIPGGGPFAPEAEPAVAGDGGSSAVASALAAKAGPSGLPKVPGWVTSRLGSVDLNSGKIADLFTKLAEVNTPLSSDARQRPQHAIQQVARLDAHAHRFTEYFRQLAEEDVSRPRLGALANTANEYALELDDELLGSLVAELK